MQITISIDSGLGYSTIADQLRYFADLLASRNSEPKAAPLKKAAPAVEANGHDEEESAETTAKRKRATKAEMEERRRAAEAASGESAKAAVEDSEEDDFGLDDEDEAPEKPAYTLSEVLAAANAFAKDHGREKAIKIIQRFGVKSVKELKPADLPMIMKAFNQ